MRETVAVNKPEHIAHSPDAAQFIKVRADGDRCIEVEAINRGAKVAVWLDPEGIDALLAAVHAARVEADEVAIED